MSKNGNGEPPSWEDLVNQVQGAMEELNLNSPENQELFVEGLREVMQSLEEMGFQVGIPAMPPSFQESKPDIQVFEGGKKDSLPESSADAAETSSDESSEKNAKKGKKATKKQRPDLKVAPPEEPGLSPKSSTKRPTMPPFPAFPVGDPESLNAMFKFLRMGEDALGPGYLALGNQGKIAIAAEGTGFQNIFRGETARAYRIECVEGGLQIYLDGEPVEEIRPGQSTDVESAAIRVKASDEAGAKGYYARIQT